MANLTLPIYMDAHATTPVDPRVIEAMLPTLQADFGNAASREHAFGWRAEALVEQARERVAALIGAEAREIVFTSGATESDNLAIFGAARMNSEERRGGGEGRRATSEERNHPSSGCGTGRLGHIVTSAIEHPAVLDPCRRLEREGFGVTYLQPGADGLITAGQVEAALEPDTFLVTLMAANNEIGTLNPLAGIGQICKARRILLHCDAVQALAWMPIDVNATGIDVLSISGHKIYGPKGIGIGVTAQFR